MADKQNAKFSLADVANLQQLAGQAPVRSATEVSKRQAIAMLAPNLHELRARGYAWRDVAAWLTEHGMAVTVSSLQRYLRSAKRALSKASEGRGKGLRSKPSTDASAAPRSALTLLSDATVNTSAAGQKNAPAAAQNPREVPGRTQAQEPRRSGFIPRPDTKDI